MNFFRHIFIASIILAFFACAGNKDGNAKVIWEKYENGNYKVVYQFLADTGNFDEDYYYQEYYENGNLKLQGMEKQRIRKGEWNFYYESKELQAKMNFSNDTLNGPIALFDRNGKITAQDMVNHDGLRDNNEKVVLFLKEQFDQSEYRPPYVDSLYLMVKQLK